ncbi:hypothetical protein C1645_736971 [Glomus cerebriforme]|uniref:Uncharacterized protein n=1 Tax=Glomus cerebriforme TaxID=658196 RepID=A0A397T199_9GLOM|nr:hypothetical protein C1645_736971 [Glomus cerebriforme]
MSSVHSNKSSNKTLRRVTRSQSTNNNTETQYKTTTNLDNKKNIISDTYGPSPTNTINVQTISEIKNNIENTAVVTTTVATSDKDIIMGNTIEETNLAQNSSSSSSLPAITTPHQNLAHSIHATEKGKNPLHSSNTNQNTHNTFNMIFTMPQNDDHQTTSNNTPINDDFNDTNNLTFISDTDNLTINDYTDLFLSFALLSDLPSLKSLEPLLKKIHARTCTFVPTDKRHITKSAYVYIIQKDFINKNKTININNHNIYIMNPKLKYCTKQYSKEYHPLTDTRTKPPPTTSKRKCRIKSLLQQSIQKINTLESIQKDINEIKKNVLDNKEKITQTNTKVDIVITRTEELNQNILTIQPMNQNTYTHRRKKEKLLTPNTNDTSNKFAFNPKIDTFSNIGSLKTISSIPDNNFIKPSTGNNYLIPINPPKHLINETESEYMENMNYEESSSPSDNAQNIYDQSNNLGEPSTSQWNFNPLKNWKY